MRRYLSHNLEIIDWYDQQSTDNCKEFSDYFSAIQFLKRFQFDTLAMMDIRSYATDGLPVCLPDYSDEKVIEIVAWRLLCGEVRIVSPQKIDIFQIHAVKQGDSLSILAKKYHITLKQLLNANPDIKNPDLINIGQNIKIPLNDVSSPISGHFNVSKDNDFSFISPENDIPEISAYELEKGKTTSPTSINYSYDLKAASNDSGSIKAIYSEGEIGVKEEGILGSINSEINVGAIRMDNVGTKGIVGGSHKMDAFHANAKAEAAAVWGVGGKASAEVQMMKESVSGFIGEKENPFIEGEAGYSLLEAEAKGDLLLGYDGKQTGLEAGASASVGPVSGKLGGEINIPILFTDWSIGLKGDVSGPSVGAGARVKFDHEEERLHIGAFGKLLLGVSLDISIGKKYKSRDR